MYSKIVKKQKGSLVEKLSDFFPKGCDEAVRIGVLHGFPSESLGILVGEAFRLARRKEDAEDMLSDHLEGALLPFRIPWRRAPRFLPALIEFSWGLVLLLLSQSQPPVGRRPVTLSRRLHIVQKIGTGVLAEKRPAMAFLGGERDVDPFTQNWRRVRAVQPTNHGLRESDPPQWIVDWRFDGDERVRPAVFVIGPSVENDEPIAVVAPAEHFSDPVTNDIAFRQLEDAPTHLCFEVSIRQIRREPKYVDGKRAQGHAWSGRAAVE
jgi:hypothetical protein